MCIFNSGCCTVRRIQYTIIKKSKKSTYLIPLDKFFSILKHLRYLNRLGLNCICTCHGLEIIFSDIQKHELHLTLSMQKHSSATTQLLHWTWFIVMYIVSMYCLHHFSAMIWPLQHSFLWIICYLAIKSYISL